MVTFSNSLEQAIHAAIAAANARHHELATLEHLLLALVDEPDAARVMKGCSIDLDELRQTLTDFVDDDLSSLATNVAGSEAVPTAQFQRVVQRAAIHVQSSGRTEVRGGNILTAIFAERESNAAYFLQEQDMTRYDAVNFIAHGVGKDPAFTEDRLAIDENEAEPDEERLTEAEWRARLEAERRLETKAAAPTLESERPSASPFVFLSYVNQDRDLARGMVGQFERNGLSFWWDQDIEPGDEWRARIAERLETATVVLTLWTAQSTASRAVIEEASTAQSGRKLVHARLDDSRIPYGFSETQYVDLRDWDGSDSHPSFRRLLYAIEDKLAAPSVGFATRRLRESSPIEVVAHRGRLAVKDAPANAPAAVTNPAELNDRLAGLRHTISSMARICADSTAYQLPPSLHHCLEAIRTALETSPITWYALEDAKTMLSDCMVDNYAAESWNTVVFNGLTKLILRIDQIRPLLQPVQIDPRTNEARPPVPEPHVNESDMDAAITMVERARSELASEEGRAAIDETTAHLMDNALSQMRDSKHSQDEHKLFKFRRALKSATFIVGGLVTAVGTGVVVNLLTAPSAAQTLSSRLKPIFESILQFFL